LFKVARDSRGINNFLFVQTWQNTPSFFKQNVEVRILAWITGSFQGNRMLLIVLGLSVPNALRYIATRKIH